MKHIMTLNDLLLEVRRQAVEKRDYATNTKDNIRLVLGHTAEDSKTPYLVLLRHGSEQLERFSISDNAHSQIAAKLSIPKAYYDRLWHDHPDMLLHNVNELFEREPASRLLRILDGQVRAFLSDRYSIIDNVEVLEAALPAIVEGGIETDPLQISITPDNMHLKILFSDPALEREVAKGPNGAPRIMKPAFVLSNSETGNGTFSVRGMFYDTFCRNGCIFGAKDAFGFSVTHLGGKLETAADFSVISETTKRKASALAASQFADSIKALSDPRMVDKMAEKLREANQSEPVKSPVGAVDMTIKQLGLKESERESVLETFIRDRNYSKYGLQAAVTELANKEETPNERIHELEKIGFEILNLTNSRWNQFVQAEPAKVRIAA